MQYSDRLALRSPRDRVKSTIILQTVPETVTVDGRHRFYLPQPVHLVPSTTSAWPCLRSTNYANDKDARSSYPQAPSMPVLLGYTSGAKHVSHTTQLDLMEVISEKLLYVQYSLFFQLAVLRRPRVFSHAFNCGARKAPIGTQTLGHSSGSRPSSVAVL